MEHEETYKGQKIRIRTGRSADGTWQASAEFADQASEAVAVPSGAFSSELEARSAALSAAMAHVDRSRARVGKP